MAKVAFCIFCESLDVTETTEESKFEYYCHECGESWADDESEYEAGL